MIWRLLILLLAPPLFIVILDLTIMRPLGLPFALRLGIALTIGLLSGIVGMKAILNWRRR